MTKKPLIEKPYFYDTKEGIDHFTKTVIDDSSTNSPEKIQELKDIGTEMKKSVLNHHIKATKKFDNMDPSTYPSNPKVRGRLLEIDKLEKDLAPKTRTGNPSGRDYWKETVALNKKNKGEVKLPKVSPEDRNKPDVWKDVIYPSMTPLEKGQWNAEQRKLKEQVTEKKLVDLPILNRNIDYQKMPRQDLKNNMRKWINETDKEREQKKEVVYKPKATPGVQSILHIDLPQPMVSQEITPDVNQSVNQRIQYTKTKPGISVELAKLQKDINRNIDYVLGKTEGHDERNNKEET